MYSADKLSCVNCPVYTRAQYGQTSCAPDACGYYQIVKPSGKCESCPSGQEADVTQRTCVNTG